MFWQYDGLDPPHARERCLPTGTVEIVINLGDDARATKPLKRHPAVAIALQQFRSVPGG